MKIEGTQVGQLLARSPQEKTAEVPSNMFLKLMNHRSQEGTPGTKEKIHELFDTVEKLKGVLDYDLTVDNLKTYKEAVRSFLSYYTNHELQMENTFARDKRGYEQKLQLIRSTDEKLNGLTENMLETNQGHLETIRSIGEIQGLIVNIYI